MDVEGSAANAAGVTSQEYLTRYRGSLSRGEMYRGAEARFPLYAERIRVARRRGQPRRRTRADVSSPRPRPRAAVTSRSPLAQRARGRGGRWEKPPTRSAPQPHGGNKKRALSARPAERAPTCGGRAAGCPHAAEEPRQTRGEAPHCPWATGASAPHCPWATGAGGRVCRAPPLVGGDGDGRRAHGSRALCARPFASRAGLWPAAPHTLDVPQPPLAARDNERRAHGPCAHASDANRRTQCRAA